jgi:hypothetical protein
VIKGGRANLLASYEIERKPVATRNIKASMTISNACLRRPTLCAGSV